MAHERRQYILRLLEQRGSIRSAALAAELGVTDETIRTDLVALQKKGLLKRIHGGAEYIVPGTTAAPADLEIRADVAMAKIVAAHISKGSRIYADPCPFSRILAQELENKPCTFLTSSPQFCLHLAPKALPHEVICYGGMLDKESRLIMANDADDFFERNYPDFAVLRPPALRNTSCSYHSLTMSIWAQKAAQKARKCIIAVPSLNLSAEARFCIPLPDFHLITEDNLPPQFTVSSIQTIPHISPDLFVSEDHFVF